MTTNKLLHRLFIFKKISIFLGHQYRNWLNTTDSPTWFMQVAFPFGHYVNRTVNFTAILINPKNAPVNYKFLHSNSYCMHLKVYFIGILLDSFQRLWIEMYLGGWERLISS